MQRSEPSEKKVIVVVRTQIAPEASQRIRKTRTLYARFGFEAAAVAPAGGGR